MTGLDLPQRSVESDKGSVRSAFHAYQFESGSTPRSSKTEPSFLLLDSPFAQNSPSSKDSGRTTQLSKAASELSKPASDQSKPDLSASKLPSDSTQLSQKTLPDSSKADFDSDKSKSGSVKLPGEAVKSSEPKSSSDNLKPLSQKDIDLWFGAPKHLMPDSGTRPSSGDLPSPFKQPDANVPWRKPDARDKPPQKTDTPSKNTDKVDPRFQPKDQPSEKAPAREFNLRDRIKDGSIPDAKIYVPPGFDPSKPANLIIYNHGWRDTAGSAFRNANLKEQMAMAPPNSILVIPAWQASEGAESSVEDRRFTRNLMGMLQGSLRAQSTDMNNVGSISIVSHSAGGTPVERELNALRGTALYDRISSVASLDTNYGHNQPAVDNWIAHNIQNGKFARGESAFLNLYASGTDDGSRAQAARVARMLSNPSLNPGHNGALLDRGSAVAHGGTVRVQDLSRLPIVFQNTGDAHGRFPGKFFGHAISKVRNRTDR